MAAQQKPGVRLRMMALRIKSLIALRFFLRAGKNVILVVLAYAAAAAVLSGFKDIGKYPVFDKAVRVERSVEDPALAFIRRTVPTNYDGRDISRTMLFGSLIVAALLLRGYALKFESDAFQLKRRLDAEMKKAATLLQADKMDRAELLKVYAEVRRSLDEHKQHLAFLSIDIVDSTGMKKGEDPGIAENDFRQYKKLVDDIITAKKAMKSTWTPDGVMICFPSVEQAVTSAQLIVLQLDNFNRSVKAIKRDFQIRAGINAGEVFCDDSTPMEEMTDRVIDIAGHMQKHGVVDGIAISKHAIEPFLDRFPFKDAQRVVDALPVYEWKKGDPVPT